jgi:hypothetical protein
MVEMEKDITSEEKKRQLIRFGHTNKMDEKRLPREVQEWVPREKRKGGRPKRGWRDDIKEAMEARDFAEEDLQKRRMETGGREMAKAVKYYASLYN